MSKRLSRRRLLRDAALAGVGICVCGTARNGASPNQKLNLAFVGCGGRGEANLGTLAKEHNVVALCDVDESRAARSFNCHLMDLPFWALDLRQPTSIEAEGPPVHPETTPRTLTVRYEFPARGELPPVQLTWRHGRMSPRVQTDKVPAWGYGFLFVGEKGMLLADYNRRVLLPEATFADFKPPEPTLPDSPGHYAEWVAACKTGSPTGCHFDYSGALTEAVLLGNVAFRAGQKLQWDPLQLEATNCPEADQYIRRQHRTGWTL